MPRLDPLYPDWIRNFISNFISALIFFRTWYSKYSFGGLGGPARTTGRRLFTHSVHCFNKLFSRALSNPVKLKFSLVPVFRSKASKARRSRGTWSYLTYLVITIIIPKSVRTIQFEFHMYRGWRRMPPKRSGFHWFHSFNSILTRVAEANNVAMKRSRSRAREYYITKYFNIFFLYLLHFLLYHTSSK